MNILLKEKYKEKVKTLSIFKNITSINMYIFNALKNESDSMIYCNYSKHKILLPDIDSVKFEDLESDCNMRIYDSYKLSFNFEEERKSSNLKNIVSQSLNINIKKDSIDFDTNTVLTDNITERKVNKTTINFNDKINLDLIAVQIAVIFVNGSAPIIIIKNQDTFKGYIKDIIFSDDSNDWLYNSSYSKNPITLDHSVTEYDKTIKCKNHNPNNSINSYMNAKFTSKDYGCENINTDALGRVVSYLDMKNDILCKSFFENNDNGEEVEYREIYIVESDKKEILIDVERITRNPKLGIFRSESTIKNAITPFIVDGKITMENLNELIPNLDNNNDHKIFVKANVSDNCYTFSNGLVIKLENISSDSNKNIMNIYYKNNLISTQVTEPKNPLSFISIYPNIHQADYKFYRDKDTFYYMDNDVYLEYNIFSDKVINFRKFDQIEMQLMKKDDPIYIRMGNYGIPTILTRYK